MQILVILLITLLVGWFAGMFINYIVDILPIQRRFAPLICSNCDQRVNNWIYYILPIRCPVCGKERSMRTWLVVISLVIISVCLWFCAPEKLGYALGMILMIYFGIVTVIDIEHRLIMHPVSLVGAIIGIGLGTRLHGLAATIIGGIVGFVVMLGFYLLGIGFVRLSARIRHQYISDEEGIGFGDVFLSAIIGFLLGWPGIIAGLIIAILLGGFFSVAYILIMLFSKRYRPSLSIPYGPFIVASAVILLFLKNILPI